MAYYQQVGRAGRAVSAAVGVLMSGREDEEIQENFRVTAFPFPWDIEVVLNALCSSKGKSGLTEQQLEQHCNLRPRDIIRVFVYYRTFMGYHVKLSSKQVTVTAIATDRQNIQACAERCRKVKRN